jgi:predicted AlkP superfamily phosphohydrolase/phosphomutase
MKLVVIFGLDGATYTVLDELVARGVMPYLGQFMAEGARATLLSNIPPLTPPAWTSLVTGRNPGQHGITGFFQYQSPESLAIQIVSARQVQSETIWSMVNRCGLRAGSLNFVVHHPAPPVDGYIVPGWIPWRWMKRMSHPRNLIERIVQQLPGFNLKEIGMDFDQERRSVVGEAIEDYRAWIDLHIRRDRQWFALLRHQMLHDPCHLTGVVFDGVDKIQHSFWPYLDPRREPQNPGPEYLEIREACWDYFRRIDDFLRETVQLVGSDAAVFVVSDHGFTGSDEIVYINTWLEREGYLAWKQDTATAADDSQELEPDFYRLSAFDMSRTQAFALTASSNGIHIVVRGKKAEHGIRPEEYENFRGNLRDALLTRCVDPNTGEPLVTEVWTREEVFAGPHMELAPDLTLTLRDHGFFSVRRSHTILRKRPRLMGTHHPEGIFLARGAGIQAGARLDEPARLIDVAPTVLFSLQAPIPANLDGRVLDSIFEGEYLAANAPPSSEPALVMAAAAGDPEPGGDDSAILEKLKALGYIE